MDIAFGIIIVAIIIIAVCYAFYSESDDLNRTLIMLLLLILLFMNGIVIGQEMNTDIKTSDITTYTYQCQICEESTTTTNEPQFMICDKCIEAIKNIKGE